MDHRVFMVNTPGKTTTPGAVCTLPISVKASPSCLFNIFFTIKDEN